EGRLAELGAARDGLTGRVAELEGQLEAANASLRDAERACDALDGYLGIAASEGDGGSDAPVAGRLRRASVVVRELTEQHSRRLFELFEVDSRRMAELAFYSASSALSLQESNEVLRLLEAQRGEAEALTRCFFECGVLVNGATEDLRASLSDLVVCSSFDECSCKAVEASSFSGGVDLAGFVAEVGRLRRLAEAWHAVAQSQRVACGRYEGVGESLRDVFAALGMEAPAAAVADALEAREEALGGVVAWAAAAGDEGRAPLARYAEAAAGVLGAVEADVLRCVPRAVGRIAELRRAHDAVVAAVGEGKVWAAAAAGGGEEEAAAALPRELAGPDVEEEPVVTKIHWLQLCVRDARTSLATSVGGVDDDHEAVESGVGAVQQPFAALPLEKRVHELREECEKAAAAFVEIKSLLCGDTEEQEARDGGDGAAGADGPGAGLPVHGYDDLVRLARRCVARAREEREKNQRLCEELRRMLDNTSATPDSPAGSSPPVLRLQPPVTADAAVLASEKTKLLMSMREPVDTEADAGGAGQTLPSPKRLESFEIVHQVKDHINSRAAEVRVLRTAMTTSVETLGGDALSHGADSHAIASVLLDLVRETSSSISEVHAIIDPDSAAVRHGPLRLRDIVGRLEAKVQNWERSMREARALVDSVMHVNDPNFALVAPPGRALTRKAKPQPVAAGRVDDPLVLSRTFPASTEGAMLANLDAAAVPAASATSCPTSVSSADAAGGFGLNEKLIRDAVLEVRAKLVGIRQLTNACVTAVCLMGGGEGGSQTLDMLPVRLLQKAQEVSEVIQMTRDAAAVLDEAGEGQAEAAAACGGDGGSLAMSPTLRARVERLIKGAKVLRNENGTLRLEGDVLQRQKAFLLRDFEDMRLKYARAERLRSEALAKLSAERDELRGKIEGCTRDIQQRDDTLAQQQQRTAELQEACNRLHVECELLQRHLTTVRATRDDLQASEMGLRDAAVMVRRASAFVREGLYSAIEQPARKSFSQTAAAEAEAVAAVKPAGAPAQDEEREDTVQASAVRDAVPSAAQLLAESGRDLRRCGQALQQLRLHLRTETQLRNWVLQVCEQKKVVLVDWEAAERALLLEAFRAGVLWLSEKKRAAKEREDAVHSLQQRLEEEFRSHEEERATWRRRLHDLDESYAERGATLQRCMDSLRDCGAQQELLRTEAENWRFRAAAAADEAAATRADACKLRQALEELRGHLEGQTKRSTTPAGGAGWGPPRAARSWTACRPSSSLWRRWAAMGRLGRSGWGSDWPTPSGARGRSPRTARAARRCCRRSWR
ncbi:uncharacterized protein Tco025E_02134, partial [Trypanosoma conorhini]